MYLFTNLPTIFLALTTGILFGFLLRKANVSRFDTIVGQLLLKDFTVMKVILTAIVVGSFGMYSLHALGIIPTIPLPKNPLLWTALGGGVFGIGMSVAGYCPGTSIASLADGAKEMWFGVLGMIAASFLFNELSGYFIPLLEKRDATFEQTLFSFFHIPKPIMLGLVLSMWLGFVWFMRLLESRKKVTCS